MQVVLMIVVRCACVVLSCSLFCSYDVVNLPAVVIACSCGVLLILVVVLMTVLMCLRTFSVFLMIVLKLPCDII